MKTIAFALLLTGASLWAQAPAPPPAPPAPTAPAAPTAAIPGPSTRSTPRFSTAKDTNSIIAPLTDDSTTMVAIAPTNAIPEETLKAGMIDFRKMDLDAVLLFYADLVNRTVLRPSGLASQPITLKTQTDLTKHEAIQALDTVLGMNGIVMINEGDKFVKAVQAATAGTEAA